LVQQQRILLPFPFLYPYLFRITFHVQKQEIPSRFPRSNSCFSALKDRATGQHWWCLWLKKFLPSLCWVFQEWQKGG
jgi:hypothetical protein